MAIESLAQQTSIFIDSMQIKTVSDQEAADKNSQEAKTPEQGDSVTISEEARAIIAAEESAESEDTRVNVSTGKPEESQKESEADRIIRMLKEQIEKLEEEIKELEESDLPEKTKQNMIQDKQAQIMELNDQLADAMEAKFESMGQTMGGGTRAKSFGNSVSDF